jgi:acyl-CoA synthetase (AMP-forming)/AMP-acid ligase II
MAQSFAEDNNTLWKKWCSNARKTPEKEAIVHWVAGEEPKRWTFSSIVSQAEKFAAFLLSCNIKRGDVCAIIIRHNYYFYPLYLAVSSIGAIPAVLAYPNSRLHPEKFRQGIEGMSQRSGLDYILTERDIEPIIDPLIKRDCSTIKGLLFPLEWLQVPVPQLDKAKEEIKNVQASLKPSDPVLLQHSSGTTGLQKPVLLSHWAVIEHIKNYSKAISAKPDDKVVIWLPMYHDMGLIAAFHLPLALGITSVQIDPFEWVLAPIILLEAISRENGTITWLPNFAYNVLSDKIHFDELEGISLSTLRLSINCSEPVRMESHLKFYSRFSEFGLKDNVLSTCYAMAETTFAVSQSEIGLPVKAICVDRQELSKGKIILAKDEISGRVCVSSGKPIDGCQVRIIGENGEDLQQGNVGEIVIRSVSMFDGYRNYPEKTAEVLKSGWYHSGDLGFVFEDYCYVIGRKKDIIIVAGNNLYPEDIEDTISQVEDVIAGRVVAFGEEDSSIGSEQVSVVVETKLTDEKDLKDLRLRIIKAGMQMDISIRKVYLVPPRWLIKSSAGKPSRKSNKERILTRKEENIWS